ncbi:Methylthioribose-1-phosphate isomerase-like protein [Drosera capensis]
MVTAGTELDCFLALQKQENLAASYRANSLREDVQKQKELEKTLQKRYGDLLAEIERTKHLMEESRVQARRMEELEAANRSKESALATETPDNVLNTESVEPPSSRGVDSSHDVTTTMMLDSVEGSDKLTSEQDMVTAPSETHVLSEAPSQVSLDNENTTAHVPSGITSSEGIDLDPAVTDSTHDTVVEMGVDNSLNTEFKADLSFTDGTNVNPEEGNNPREGADVKEVVQVIDDAGHRNHVEPDPDSEATMSNVEEVVQEGKTAEGVSDADDSAKPWFCFPARTGFHAFLNPGASHEFSASMLSRDGTELLEIQTCSRPLTSNKAAIPNNRVMDAGVNAACSPVGDDRSPMAESTRRRGSRPGRYLSISSPTKQKRIEQTRRQQTLTEAADAGVGGEHNGGDGGERNSRRNRSRKSRTSAADHLSTRNAIWDMVVRGAPAVAIAAALSLAVEVFSYTGNFLSQPHDAASFLGHRLDCLISSQPTVVNLSHAAFRLEASMQQAAYSCTNAKEVFQKAQLIVFHAKAYIEAAELMLEEDVASNQWIGFYGAGVV